MRFGNCILCLSIRPAALSILYIGSIELCCVHYRIKVHHRIFDVKSMITYNTRAFRSLLEESKTPTRYTSDASRSAYQKEYHFRKQKISDS